jgi:hypothetical protein
MFGINIFIVGSGISKVSQPFLLWTNQRASLPPKNKNPTNKYG